MTDLYRYRDTRHFRFYTSGSQQRVLEKGEQSSPTQLIANMTNKNRIRIITGDEVDIPVCVGVIINKIKLSGDSTNAFLSFTERIV